MKCAHVDWEALGLAIGALRREPGGGFTGSGGGDENRAALCRLVGDAELTRAGQVVLDGGQGARSAHAVLERLEPPVAVAACDRLARTARDDKTRRAAHALLRTLTARVRRFGQPSSATDDAEHERARQRRAARSRRALEAVGTRAAPEVVHRWRPAATISGLDIVDTDLAVAATNDGVHTLDLATGRAGWSARIGAVSKAPLLHEGTLYATQREPGRVGALDVERGAVRWTAATPSGEPFLGTPVASGRHVVAVSEPDTVCVLDPGTGAVLASHDLGASVVASPVAYRNGGVVVSHVGGICLPRVDAAATISIAWTTRPVCADVTDAPALAAGGLFFSTGAGTLHALGARDGSRLWRRDAPDGWIGPPAVGAGLVIVGEASGTVCARDLSGRLRWRLRVPGASAVGPRPCIARGVVHFDAGDAGLLAIALATGRVRWRRAQDVDVMVDVCASGRYVACAGRDEGTVIVLGDASR